MTIPFRTLRLLVATLAVAAVALPGAPVALANGLGDLYVAVPKGVAEIRLVDEKIETTVDAGSATGLAFTNDGAYLFVLDDAGALSRINIETISVDRTYTLPAGAAAIAHPKGDSLIVAYDDSKTVGVLTDGDDRPETGPALTGKPDLLAADRQEHRVVAARYGESWVNVVETPSGAITKATVDGEVVAMVVADDTGYAYVATTGPNAVVRLSLATGAVDWAGRLDGKPTAITAIDGAAIVAVDDQLWKVVDKTVTSWSKPTAKPISAVVTSDEGQFVYVATADAVEAIDKDKPGAEPRATVKLPGTAALAPVHKASSLWANGGQTTHPNDGSGASPAAGDRNPGPTRAPATDTEDGSGPLWRRPAQDPLVLFGVGGLIALAVLFGSRLLMARSVGER